MLFTVINDMSERSFESLQTLAKVISHSRHWLLCCPPKNWFQTFFETFKSFFKWKFLIIQTYDLNLERNSSSLLNCSLIFDAGSRKLWIIFSGNLNWCTKNMISCTDMQKYIFYWHFIGVTLQAHKNTPSVIQNHQMAPFILADAVISEIPRGILPNAALWLVQGLLFGLRVNTKAVLSSEIGLEVGGCGVFTKEQLSYTISRTLTAMNLTHCQLPRHDL